MHFEENESVKKWFRNLAFERSGSDHTRKHYLNVLKLFCRFTNKSPDELISDGLGSNEKIDWYGEKVKEFAMSGKKAKATVAVYTYALKSFFSNNGISLPIRRVQKWVTYEDRAITPKELYSLLHASDLRTRAEIAILAQSGMRSGSLAKLTYGHVKKGLENGEIPLRIHLSSGLLKGRVKSCDTFIGPEAIEYLKLYLESRRRGTRKIPEEKLTDDSPLFRHHKKEVKMLSYDSIYADIRKALLRTGLAQKTGKPSEIRPHSLRKFFKTQMEAAGASSRFIEHMMGHKLPGSESSYFKPTIDQLREAYVKGLPFLSLSPRTDVEDEFKRVLQTVKAKRREPDIIRFVDKILEALTEEKVYSEAPSEAYFHNNNTVNVCLKCKNYADSDALVCDQCGEKLKIECSRCNTLNKLTSNYCKKCGNKIDA